MTETSTNIGGSAEPGANGSSTLLIAELQHRAKNVFTVIEALARCILNGDRPLVEAREAFIDRLEALARADQQFFDAAGKGTSLNDLVCSELRPFAERIKVEGADVILNPRAAQNFALVLHELASNASKYGALSCSAGAVSVGWVVSNNPAGRTLTFRWQERGGPPVSLPKRMGFGTSLLKAVLDQGRLEYAIEGFAYEADVPLCTIVAREGSLCDTPLAVRANPTQRVRSSERRAAR